MKALFMKILNSSEHRVLSWFSFPLCFLSLVFLDYSFRYFYQHLSPVSVWDKHTALFTLAWSLLLTALLALLPRLARRIAMMVVSLLFAVLALVHAGMNSVFGTFFSFSALSFAGEGAAFFSWDYITIRKITILCVICAVLCMAAAALLTPAYRKKGSRLWFRVGAAAVALVSILVIAWNHSTFEKQEAGEDKPFGWETNLTATVNSRESVYTNFKDTHQCMHYAGLYQYTFRDLTLVLGLGGSKVDSQELEQYFEQRAAEISGDNEMTGILEDKNLIMIMLESIDTWMLRPEYMPNLYALQQKSVNFANHYAFNYLYAYTFNTEIVSMTGHIPPVSGLPSTAYAENTFAVSIPYLFRKAGYTANSYHPSNPNIYSRGVIHENLGFERYWNHAAMNMAEDQLDTEMLNGYESMVFDRKFFDFIITYSGHGPYNESMAVVSEPHLERARAAVAQTGITSANEDTMEQYIRAVAHAMETDAFIGGLVQRLEADGRMEDTVLLFYTDHYSKYLTDTEFIKELKGVTAQRPEDLYRVPCFLLADGIAPCTVTKYTSTVDLAPTVANLFALDVDRRYYAGDDMLGDKGGFVIMPDYSWFDGETTNQEAKSSSNEAILARNAAASQRIRMSMETYRIDFFKTLK